MHAKRRAQDAIREFSEFHSEIAEHPLDVFMLEYHRRLGVIEDITRQIPDDRQELMDQCFCLCGPELEKSALCKHTRAKPLGYAGDFQVIDWILTNKADSPGTGRLWDLFYQNESACQAVRSRAAFFARLAARCPHDDAVSVLNLACGPCRDVLHAIETTRSPDLLTFHCVDMDPHALQYAQAVIGPCQQVSFLNSNVFSLSPPHGNAIVWAGGLFDYLTDRQAVVLLRKMWRWTRTGGLVAFGNFLPSNESRLLMEWCLGWSLTHRSEQEVFNLTREAGIPQESTSYTHDETRALGFYSCNKQ
jgi:extracellular factor (EF) 3-hydroxypalmitic acid methyl ester biosynthesis protein